MGQFERSLIAADAAVRARFVAELRNRGSVSAAARATGTTRSTAYAQRRRDPDFAAAWDRALGQRGDGGTAGAVAALEAALVHRATHGTERYRFGRDGVEIWVDYDNRLALDLIDRLKAATPAAAAAPRMTRAEFLAAIEARPRSVDLPQG